MVENKIENIGKEEIGKIGVCSYCGKDVYDDFYVFGSNLFCRVCCSIDYHIKGDKND